MNKLFNRTKFIAAPLILSAGLVACGGGGSSSSSTASTVSITGVVAKGIVEGVTVTAYKLNANGTKGDSVGAGTTNEDGSYSLQLSSDYTGGPIKIEVTHKAGATMKCDLPSGCGTGVDFGQTYELSADFNLSTLSSDLSPTDTINVTPITTVAAKVAEKKLADLGIPGEGSDATAAKIAITNSEIADLFGISTSVAGDLTKVPLIDITDPDQLASASADALKYASLGPAIVEAVKAEAGNSDSIEEAITRFAEDTEDGAIKGDTGDAGVTDLKEIFEATTAVLSKADEESDETIENLVAVQTDVSSEVADATTQGEDEESGTASDTTYADNITKAKNAVAQVRELGRMTFMDALDGENSDAGAASAFQSQLSAAEAMADSDYVLEATGFAIDAIARKADEDDLPVLDDAGAQVTASQSGDTYTVNQNITVSVEDDTGMASSKVVAVNITATVVNTLTETETEEEDSADGLTYDWTLNGGINITLSGTATSADTTLTINEGSKAIGTVSAVEHEEDIDWNAIGDTVSSDTGLSRFDATLSGIDVKLDVTLAHDDGIDTATSFDGVIAATLNSIVLDEDSTSTGANGTYDETEVAKVRLGIATLGLQGGFTHGTDEFNASFGVTLNGHNRTVTDTCTYSEDWTEGYTESDECTNDFADTMIDASFALIVDANLNGVEDVAKVSLTGSRTGLASGEADVSIAYPGVELNAAFTLAEPVSGVQLATLTFTNLDGVKVVMTADYDEDAVDHFAIKPGTVSVVSGDNEAAVGTITETSDGSNIFTINYVDDTFETLQ